MLDEQTKALIRGYVKELLAEEREGPKTLSEMVTIRKLTRAASELTGWVDVEPGEYLVTAVEENPKVGSEIVSLQRRDGKEYLSLVTRTARGQTALGDEIWGS